MGCRGFNGPFPLPLGMSGVQLSRERTAPRSARSSGVHILGPYARGVEPERRARRNRANLSTRLGLSLARRAGSRLHPGPGGLHYAVGYQLPVPRAAAFTVGDVVLLRREELLDRPALLAHEARHAEQYARWGGPAMLLAYAAASAWSWLVTGDAASRNGFERAAGLVDGGYQEAPARRWVRAVGR